MVILMSMRLSKSKINSYKTCPLKFKYVEIDKLIKKDDTILVKASHSMNFEKIVEKLKDLKL